MVSPAELIAQFVGKTFGHRSVLCRLSGRIGKALSFSLFLFSQNVTIRTESFNLRRLAAPDVIEVRPFFTCLL